MKKINSVLLIDRKQERSPSAGSPSNKSARGNSIGKSYESKIRKNTTPTTRTNKGNPPSGKSNYEKDYKWGAPVFHGNEQYKGVMPSGTVHRNVLPLDTAIASRGTGPGIPKIPSGNDPTTTSGPGKYTPAKKSKVVVTKK